MPQKPPRKKSDQNNKNKLLHSEQELKIRNQIANIFLTVPDEEMYAEVLKVVLKAVGSRHGVFGYVDKDNGVLVCPSMSRDVWDKCQVPEKDIVYPRDTWGGIWGQALTEKKTLYSNKPFNVPKGHIPIARSIAVPIIHRKEAIGLLQVANKTSDYDEQDQALLEAIANSTAPILNARLQRDKHEKERRQAEEELRASEDKFRNIFDNANIMIWGTYADGRMKIFNKEAERVMGYSREEVLGKENMLLHPPEEREEIFEKFSRHKEGELKKYLELGVYTKEGKRLKVILAQATFKDAYGEDFYVVLMQDITERKRAEEELAKHRQHLEELIVERTAELKKTNKALEKDITKRKQAEKILQESEEKYRKLMETASDAVFLADMETGLIIATNAKAAQLLGRTVEEIIGLNQTQLHPPEEAEHYKNLFRKAIQDSHQEGKFLLENVFAAHKDGHHIPVEISGNIFTLKGKKIIHGIFRDITERKKAETVLKQQAQVIDQVHDCVIMTDLNGLITFWNPGAQRLYGYTQEETLGKHVSLLYFKEDYKVLENEVVAPLKEKGTHEIELRVRHKSGNPMIVHLSLSLVKDLDGNVTSMIGYTLDITKRKQAEEELKKFKFISEHSSDAHFLVDRNAKFQYVNKTACELMGYSGKELLRLGVPDVDVLYTLAKYQGLFDLIQKETVPPIETIAKRKDGTTFPAGITVTGHPIDGTPYMFSALRDITKRKRAEYAITRSEHKFRTLFQNMTEGVAIHELVYDKNGLPIDYVILDVNPAYEYHTGINAKDAIGKKATELYNSAKPPYLDIYLEVTLSGQPTFFEAYFEPMQKHFFISVCLQGENKFATVFDDITEYKRAEEKLKQSEENYKTLMGNIPDIITSVDCEGTIQFINRTVPGFSAQETLGTNIYDYIAPEYQDKVRKNLNQVFQTGKVISYETIGKGPHGKPSWYASRIVPIENDGQVTNALIISIDITERKLAKQALAQSEEQYKSLLENINVGVYRGTGGTKGRFLQANPAMAKIFGYDTLKEFLKVPISSLYQNPDERKLFMEELLQNGFVRNKELKLRKRDKTPIWASCSTQVKFDADGRIEWLDGVVEDITKRKLAEEQLQYEAIHDSLTGLFTRRYFMDRLNTAIHAAKRYGHPLSICLCDLDDLKSINDTYGHQIGDKVIAAFGQILLEELCDEDVPGRYGGDEFFILFTNVSANQAAASVERIRQHFQERSFTEKGSDPFSISATFAIADLTPEHNNGKELLHFVDQILYDAKETQRNQVVIIKPK